MIALDTNLLVRFVVNDGEQHARAKRFIEAALARRETLFIPQIVACEFVWVLRAAFKQSKATSLDLLSQLLAVPSVRFEADHQVRAAVERAATSDAGFADCLICLRSREAGCTAFATFDQVLLKDDGAIEPT